MNAILVTVLKKNQKKKKKKKALKCYHALRLSSMDLAQTWFDDRCCQTNLV